MNKVLKRMKVVRVTKTEFELEDGQVFQHPVQLDTVPSIKDFQIIYDEWFNTLNEKVNNER